MSVKSRRQTLSLRLDAAIIVVIQIYNQFMLCRMIGFQFRRYPAGTVTNTHLNYLEELLEGRVQELLSIHSHKR